MAESGVAVAVAHADLKSHETRILSMRFKPNAFEAAGDLLVIAESGKIMLDGWACHAQRLMEAFIDQKWTCDRIFIVRHYLGENPEMLDRFMKEVLPHLEVCFVSSKANLDDPRLTS